MEEESLHFKFEAHFKTLSDLFLYLLLVLLGILAPDIFIKSPLFILSK